TFGKNHQIKLLLSSSNFPKYQSNPHIPHEDGDFFRWEPGSTQTYNYYGQTLTAQNAEITYDFNPNFPSLISFPRLDTTFFTAHNNVVETLPNFDIYPNPTTDKVTVVWNKSFKGDILIYDYWGKCVKTITTDNNKLMTKIDLNGLSNGFYIVRIPELNCSKKLIKN
ncbi:MAG TPA: T9SS type A sorting domain-containing protein, partial [Taishania sp.]|nr:T9SS type A sorting domain-containing protein [Taishania sp.]